jgi:hypothetical protein
MPKFKSQLPSPNSARVTQANRRVGSMVSSPLDWSNRLDAENYNFSVLNQIFYGGRRDRIQRYDVYDAMDMDSDVHRALDIIAEHCTQKDPKTKTPFQILIEENAISHEDTEVLFQMLKIWNRQCDWDNLAFRTIRNVIKYGDFFFVRDSEFNLHPLSPRNVSGAYIDEETYEIQAYHLVDLKRKYDFMQEVTEASPQVSMYAAGRRAANQQQDKGKTYAGIIEAQHIIHLSMSEGMEVGGNGQNGDIWPFGDSMLERVYKDYKARSLLEEAEVIHRIQRAPSRRVFYIDVGKMRPDKSESYARKVKNELQQKRIPSAYGGTSSVDSVYNPISQMEDLFLTVTSDGRGTKVETLEGQAWADEGPLTYFNNKLNKGLGVPNSYMQGPEDGGSTYNDGRVGTAYLQEGQFAKMCERIQDLNDNLLDNEFKLYLDFRGIQIHSSSFDLKFIEPISFDEYREMALNQERLGVMGSASQFPWFAKRFLMKKFGNMSEDDIIENEHLFMEENMSAIARQYDQENELGGMGVGIGGLSGNMSGEFGGDFMGGDEFGNEFGGEGAEGGVPGGQFGGPAAGGGAFGGAPGGGIGGAGAPGVESFIGNPDKLLTEAMRSIQYAEGDQEALKEAMMKYIRSVGNRTTLKEDVPEIDPNDLIAVEKQPQDKEPVPNDGMFGAGYKQEEDTNIPIIPMSHIRKLRLEREKSRKDLIKRLFMFGTIYSSAGQDTGGFGGF